MILHMIHSSTFQFGRCIWNIFPQLHHKSPQNVCAFPKKNLEHYSLVRGGFIYDCERPHRGGKILLPPQTASSPVKSSSFTNSRYIPKIRQSEYLGEGMWTSPPLLPFLLLFGNILSPGFCTKWVSGGGRVYHPLWDEKRFVTFLGCIISFHLELLFL